MQIALRPLRELERQPDQTHSLQQALRARRSTDTPMIARQSELWTRTFRASGKDGKAVG